MLYFSKKSLLFKTNTLRNKRFFIPTVLFQSGSVTSITIVSAVLNTKVIEFCIVAVIS
jgi:hypothetical protein